MPCHTTTPLPASTLVRISPLGVLSTRTCHDIHRRRAKVSLPHLYAIFLHTPISIRSSYEFRNTKVGLVNEGGFPKSVG